ncbi:uncharacterized protein CLUP02_18334 [Colletotrichum lupini]|uniref:Uncharacterized protein n=1 Tax=Colletotrichum lupini TaxID=145971 RepID=A0A9Q8SG92_9PEZI|nr:uncharacterized protein CLUP02_18334 [Colletotrichum lupini]UQC76819.1 hypothetical protein CLUP02_18334 [Colletotrichum lupini]
MESTGSGASFLLVLLSHTWKIGFPVLAPISSPNISPDKAVLVTVLAPVLAAFLARQNQNRQNHVLKPGARTRCWNKVLEQGQSKPVSLFINRNYYRIACQGGVKGITSHGFAMTPSS